MARLPIRIGSALLVCIAATWLWAARPGGFRVLGPGGGGAMFNPTVSPHDKETVLVSCDMTGGYITHNGGKSWRMFNLRGTVRFFAFDPVDPKTIYAEVNGLWRSADGGETWRLLYPRPSAIKAIERNSDHADERIVAEPDPLGQITALAIDPGDSNALYAAAVHGGQSALFVSHNRGESWGRGMILPEAALRVWLGPKAAGERKVYLGGAHALEVVDGNHLRSFPTPESMIGYSAGSEGDADPITYAVSDRAAFVSVDGGRNWKSCILPGKSWHARAIATSRKHPETAYLSFEHLESLGQTWMGVAKTVNAGKSWTLVWQEEKTAAPNIHDAWITARLGPNWGESPLALGVADQDADLCYGTDLGRTMRTTDGGRNWSAVYSRRVPGHDWTSTGLDVTTSYGIHFDPFDRNRQFITYTDIGLFRSEDGGNSWTSSTNGVPREWRNTTYWVAFDPTVKNRMWSANSYSHDLPRPKMWRHNSPENFLGGVCRSQDGGRTWVKSNAGMPEAAVTHILLDSASPPAARVVYAAAFGRGVYKSADGGATWTLKNNGIEERQPFAWRLTRAPSGTLYVILSRRSEDGSIGNAGDGALYKSTDAAEHWERVALPEGVNGPNGLAIDPQSAKRLYLAAWARAKGEHGEGGGIFVSDNGGRSWRQTLDRDQHVYDVTVDAQHPEKLYAAGFESSAWRSIDRGEHWNRISGFNFKWAHRVIVDPADQDSVYVTTFGGSVWHGKVNGNPAALDIATPRLMPGQGQ